MQKVIVITSGKGGVGKTTSVINLGAALNNFGKNVLIVDGNLTTPNIGIFLNSPEVPISLNHVLQKKADVYEAVYEHNSGIKVIPSSISIKELKKIKPEKMKDFNNDFDKYYDKYTKKAKEEGYEGDLKFKKERGKIIIFVEI